MNGNNWVPKLKFEKAPLFIDDTFTFYFWFKSQSKTFGSQHGIRIIIVDYLQLMTAGGNGKGGGREQEILLFRET
jgi:replicative DNA helicase